MMISVEQDSHAAGFSMLEVLIALLVLSMTVVGAFSLLTTADRAAGVGKSWACAGTLAANEAERIKYATTQGDALSDTTYTDSIEGQLYEVKRTAVAGDSLGLLGSGIQEIEILLTKKPGDKVVGKYRLLAGTPR